MPRAVDHTLPLRGAVVLALRGDAPLAALLGAGTRVHGEQPADPKWPWVRWGRPLTTPDESTTHIGSIVRATLHVFTDDEGLAHQVANRLVALLDGEPLDMHPDDLPPGSDAHVSSMAWLDTQVGPDTARKGGYHAVVQFEAVTAETR